MPLASGLASQWGFVQESTYGVPVTVTRFVPLVSESLIDDRDRLESAGIIAGKRVLLSQSWSAGNTKVAGDLGLELDDRSLGLLFTNMFGAVSTSGAGPFTHVFTPGDLSGKSLTMQVGRPSVLGVVHPFTFPGCKIGSWEIACKAGEIATLGLSVIGRNVVAGSRTVTDGTTATNTTVTSATAVFGEGDIGKPITGTGIPANTTIAAFTSATSVVISAAATATASGLSLVIGVALATAAYTAGIKPLTFVGGTAAVGGASVQITEASIKGDNKLKDDRRYIGDRLIGEPLEMDLRDYTGQLGFEFTDLVQYNRFGNASEVAVTLGFTVPGSTNSVTITGNVRFDGTAPTVSGRGVLEQSVPVKFIASGATDSTAITATLVNGDSAP